MLDSGYENGNGARGASAMTGFMIGALVGAGVALLLAPASGTETRRRLGETTKRLRDQAKDRMGQAKDLMHDVKEDAMSAVESGREAFQRSRHDRSGTFSRPTMSEPGVGA